MVQQYDRYQWLIYGVMTVTSMGAIIAGVVDQGWLYLAMYILWTSAAASFTYIALREFDNHLQCLVRTFFSLLFAAATLWFLSATLGVEANAIPMYIPLATNIGIFFSVSVCHVWKPLKESGHTLIISGAALVLEFMRQVDDRKATSQDLELPPEEGIPLDQDIEAGSRAGNQ